MDLFLGNKEIGNKFYGIDTTNLIASFTLKTTSDFYIATQDCWAYGSGFYIDGVQAVSTYATMIPAKKGQMIHKVSTNTLTIYIYGLK